MSQKPIVWLDNEGTPCYAPSAFGGCPRALVAARLGYDQMSPPDALQKVYSAGHSSEDECVELLKSRGWNIHSQQDEAVLEVATKFGRALLIGHIDGEYDTYEMVGADEDGLIAAEGIAEIKSQGRAAWDRYEVEGPTGDLWERYEWQASVYMLAKGKPLTWIRWLRHEEGEEPSWAVHSLTVPPHSIEEITARIEMVEEYAAKSELPPCGTERWGCPYFYLHEGYKPPDDAVEVVGLEALCAKYEKYRVQEADAKRERDRVRARIQELMSEVGASRGIEGHGRVTISTQVRKSLDEKAMAADGIDVEKYRVEKEIETVRVTVKD